MKGLYGYYCNCWTYCWALAMTWVDLKFKRVYLNWVIFFSGDNGLWIYFVLCWRAKSNLEFRLNQSLFRCLESHVQYDFYTFVTLWISILFTFHLTHYYFYVNLVSFYFYIKKYFTIFQVFIRFSFNTSSFHLSFL